MAKHTKSGKWARALGALIAILAITWGLGATAGTLRSQTADSGPPVTGDQLTASYDVSAEFGGGDNVIRLIDPAGCGNAGVPNQTCGDETDICAMIYVFDDNQEMGECCGCGITPNELETLSVQNNLTSNWALASGDNQSGVIQIITSEENNFNTCHGSKGCFGGCDPTVASIPTDPDSNLDASISRPQIILSVHGMTEVPFTDDGPSEATESAYLVAQCGAIVANGTGGGVCNCPSPQPSPSPRVPTPTPTTTPTPTGTPTPTATATHSATATPTVTSTSTPTTTATRTSTPTPTTTTTATPTTTSTPTTTATPTGTVTSTPTSTPTAAALGIQSGNANNTNTGDTQITVPAGGKTAVLNTLIIVAIDVTQAPGGPALSGLTVTPPATTPGHPAWNLIISTPSGPSAPSNPDLVQLLYWHVIGSSENAPPSFSFSFGSGTYTATGVGINYGSTCTQDPTPCTNPISDFKAGTSDAQNLVSSVTAVSVPASGIALTAFGTTNTLAFFGQSGSPSGTVIPALLSENNNSGINAGLALYDTFEGSAGSFGPFTATLPNNDTGDNVAQSVGIIPQ